MVVIYLVTGTILLTASIEATASIRALASRICGRQEMRRPPPAAGLQGERYDTVTEEHKSTRPQTARRMLMQGESYFRRQSRIRQLQKQS